MRRLLRAGLAALLAVPPLLLVSGTAAAQAPDAQGWWYAANRADVTGAGVPAPPAPPDVAPDDLLLQGGDPFAVLPAGTASQPPMPTALAALRFAVPDGATVGSLVLPVAAGAQAAGVVAYPTGDAWVPVQGGPYEQAPVPDTTRPVPGVLSGDGTTLSFAGIGALATDGVLSVVLVPGPADRVVVHHPGAGALVVQDGSAPSPPDPAPPAAAAAPAPSGARPAVAPPVAAPVLPGVVTAPAGTAPAATAPAPAVALPQPPQVPVALPVALTSGRLLRADDTRTRVVVAVEALLVLVTFGLAGAGPLGRLALLTGDAGPVDPDVRGVGRFRARREGQVPRL